MLLAALAVTAPMAHVLELPNKLQLDGPIWLAVQQQLYRGWGPVFGPVEIGSLLTALALVAARRRSGPSSRRTNLVAAAYAGMLAVFFAVNDPINRALATWTPDALPAGWPDYRLRWEIGHALSAALAILALTALIGAWRRDAAA
jgi:hypothetical protein